MKGMQLAVEAILGTCHQTAVGNYLEFALLANCVRRDLPRGLILKSYKLNTCNYDTSNKTDGTVQKLVSFKM